MTITVSLKIERVLTAEADRLGTTPDLLAEQILMTSLASASEADAPSPSPSQALADLVAKAQTLILPDPQINADDTPFGEMIVEKYRKQGFSL